MAPQQSVYSQTVPPLINAHTETLPHLVYSSSSKMATNATKLIGSMADLPKNLLEEAKHLEEVFLVPASKLKEITHHFITELDKGES